MLDTNVYIDYLSRGVWPSGIGAGYLYASSVVLEELYAGAGLEKVTEGIDQIYDVMEQMGRLVTPLAADWKETGTILARIGRKFGFEQIGRGRMTNDVLIALCARRADASLYTANASDFKRIRNFLDFEFRTI